VINLSLGGYNAGPVAEWVYREARDQGVIIVAAAGNDGSSLPSYPAAFDSVVSVSALAMDESRASYSNWGDTIDVAAPGGDGGNSSEMVLSTCGEESGGAVDYTYAYMQGTSMASPHMAGVVALMKSLYPGMTPDEFDYLLEGGYLTRDIGDEGRDDSFGWGLIDAYKAVSVVRDGSIDATLPAVLTVSPTVMHFGAALSSLEAVVANSGGGALALADGSPTWSASWLSVTASGDVGADGLGAYLVAVDPEGLSEGKYYDTIFFTAAGGDEKEISVILRVASEVEGTDTGYYYILLIDARTHETVGQVETGGAGGVYDYSFDELAYGGSYIILGGTDPDNDYYICDSGEACGAYTSLDSPLELTVTSDLSEIDFTTDAVPDLSSVAVLQALGISLPLEREALEKDGE
jgi:serine protease